MINQNVNVSQNNLCQSVELSDGRTLSYAEYGDRQGLPVFHFHGGNSSRLEGQWLADAATSHHIRLLAPDRPGFGLSDPHPERTFLSWAVDVAKFADALDIDRFAVMGLSGGAPHAAVVAHQLPQRVTAVALVSGLAPPNMPGQLQGMFLPLRLNFLAARYAPSLNRWFLGKMSHSYANPDKFLKMVKQGMPNPDQILAEQRPEAIRQFSAAAVESHRQGIAGDFTEWQLYVRPWGFHLNEISRPVALWYGAVDNFVPAAMGRYLAGQIPNSRLHIVPDGGHFSTIHNHAGAILTGLREASAL
ncbi:MAG TPA: alpha/beta hydrolase [Caldilineaceae bacterium]|nr:alpha/beta hydrolase [Caldilineaceae bacterium]